MTRTRRSFLSLIPGVVAAAVTGKLLLGSEASAPVLIEHPGKNGEPEHHQARDIVVTRTGAAKTARFKFNIRAIDYSNMELAVGARSLATL